MKLRNKIAAGFAILLAVAIAALGFTLNYESACEPAVPVTGDGERMQAAQASCYGSPDVIELVDILKPTPADDEVLVRVMAASVNPLDWHYLRGSPFIMRLESGIGRPVSVSMGVDFAGTVEAVGNKVTRFQPGDDVFGGRSGAFADYLTIREDKALAMKPANMSFLQAATVPIAGVTALQALRDRGKVKPGQKVLINGASGGVGTFAVQIAKSLGAEVTAVCSTRNLELVRSLGADRVIDYTKTDYTDGDQRYDVIVDMVGNHGVLANRAMLIPGGKLIIVGGGKGNWIGPLMNPLKALVLSPFVDEELAMILAQFNQDDLATLGVLMQTGELTPVIDRSYRLSELADAVRYSEKGHARGKIVIDFQQKHVSPH